MYENPIIAKEEKIENFENSFINLTFLFTIEKNPKG